MENISLVFIVVGFIITIIFIWLLFRDIKAKSNVNEDLVNWLKQVSDRVETSSLRFDSRLDQTMRDFNTRLENTSSVMSQVQKSIGEFSEIGRSMSDIQDLLKSPKLRGNIGEHILETLLNESLPKAMYKKQHTFSSGSTVDFVIKTGKGLIPIDAKFPAENYQKYYKAIDDITRKKAMSNFIIDVKTHISAISSKYVRPDEGTIDYAIMYIPAESIYYEIISNTKLYDFSREKRVLLVSPMSFYAYLRVILLSFEGERIEKQAQEILGVLKSLDREYQHTEKALTLLQKHMTNAYNQLSHVMQFFSRFGERLEMSKILKSEHKELEKESPIKETT